MSSGGPDGASAVGKGKGRALPAGYTPPGGVVASSRAPWTPGGTPPILPTPGADKPPAVESLQAEVEALRQRLSAQEAVNKSLTLSNDKLMANVEALRLAASNDSVQVTPPRRRAKARGPTSSRSLPQADLVSRERRKAALRQELRELRRGTAPTHRRRVDEDPAGGGSSSSSSVEDSSTSGDGSDPPPPSPSSSPKASDSSESSDASSQNDSDETVPGPYRRRRRRQDHKEQGDRSKVIRPANSRFKSLLDYRTYFLRRRSLAYPPALVEKTHKMNKRLDGALQGQDPFTGADPLGVFTFLTTFCRACDSAGVTHGQALPLLSFRLAGAAKRSFSNALNSRSGHKRYALRTYGDAINWLLAKYATHSVMATAYQDIITMRQYETEAPTAFGLRVETRCDRLDGLFHVQDVKDVFINGLSEIVQSHVRVLDGQFPERTLADTVAAAQMYWDGTIKLRQSLRTLRTPTVKVALADQAARSLDRPFAQQVPPPRTPTRSPPPTTSRSDVCYNCNKPGHYAAQCAEPYRPRDRRPQPPARVNAVAEASGDDWEAASKNEEAGHPSPGCPAEPTQ